MLSSKKYLYICCLFIEIIFNNLLYSNEQKESLYFLDGRTCAECVIQSVSSAINGIENDCNPIKQKFIYTTDDTILINKFRKLLPQNVEIISGKKAKNLFSLYSSDESAQFIIIQDDNLNMIRINNIKNNYDGLKKTINDFFKNNSKLHIKELASFDVGYIRSIKSLAKGYVLVNQKQELFIIDSNYSMTKLDIYNSGAEKYKYLSTNEIPIAKNLEEEGTVLFKPRIIINASDSNFVVENSIISKINIDTVEYNNSKVRSIAPRFIPIGLNYSMKNNSYRIMELPNNIAISHSISFQLQGYKDINVFYKYLDNDIDLSTNIERDTNLVMIMDSKFNFTDSVSLFNINRLSSVNILKKGYCEYVPKNDNGDGLLFSIASGLYMIRNKDIYTNIIKSGIISYRHLDEISKNSLYNYTNYKYNLVKFTTVVPSESGYYIFNVAESRNNNDLYISKVDDNGLIISQNKIQLNCKKINTCIPFDYNNNIIKLAVIDENEKLKIIELTINN